MSVGPVLEHRVAADGRICARCRKDLGPLMGLSKLPGTPAAGLECDAEAVRLEVRKRTKPLSQRGKKSRRWKLERIGELYVRDGRLCQYCGRSMMPLDEVERLGVQDGRLPTNYPTIDHVIPRTRGGSNDLDNLVVACSVCNVRKSDSEIEHVALEKRGGDGRKVDASRCDLCHGQGRGWDEDRDKPCPDCRGAGKMSIDRYAELLADRSIRLARSEKRVTELREQVRQLRELVEAAAGGWEVWRDREQLAERLDSQRRTIKQMAARIEELGGGRPRLHVVEDETA